MKSRYFTLFTFVFLFTPGVVTTSGFASTLEAKAADYLNNILRHHLDRFQVLTRVQGGGFDDQGDSATYTSYFVAAEAFRFQATGNKTAYRNVSKGLAALHRLHVVTRQTGVVGRYVNPDGSLYLPGNPLRDITSRDVYAAVMFAYSVTYPILPNGSLKRQVEKDVRQIAEHLIMHNYAIIGDRAFIDLKPGFDRTYVAHIAAKNPAQFLGALRKMAELLTGDGITVSTLVSVLLLPSLDKAISLWPLDWCRINPDTRRPDDEVICFYKQHFRLDEVIALRRFVGDLNGVIGVLFQNGGPQEALEKEFLERLLLDKPPSCPPGVFCAPQVPCELLGNDGCAARKIAILKGYWESAFTSYLTKLLRVIRDLPQGLPALIRTLLITQFGSDRDFLLRYLLQHDLPWEWVEFIFQVVDNPDHFRQTMELIASRLPNTLGKPEDLAIVSTNALVLLQTLKTAAEITRDPTVRDRYENLRPSMTNVIKNWQLTAKEVARRFFGPAGAKALDIGGSHQLPWLAIYSLLSTETDAQARTEYYKVLEQMFEDVKDENNAFAATIFASFVNNKPVVGIMQDLVQFPSYGVQGGEYAEERDPAVLLDFGGYVEFFGKRGTRDAIPLDRRPRDPSVWQRSGHRLSSGTSGRIFSGVDYILAYWMARAHGLLSGEEPNKIPPPPARRLPQIKQRIWGDGNIGQCNGGFYGEEFVYFGEWTSQIRWDTDNRAGGCWFSMAIVDPDNTLDGFRLRVNVERDGQGQCDEQGERDVPITSDGSIWSRPFRLDPDDGPGGCQILWTLRDNKREDIVFDFEFFPDPNPDSDSYQCGNVGLHSITGEGSVRIRLDTDGRPGGCRQRMRLRPLLPPAEIADPGPAEYIDLGRQEQGMHACPPRYAIGGVHVADNRLLCRKVARPEEEQFLRTIVDKQTQRSGMHACPAGMYMRGVHVAANLLLCSSHSSIPVLPIEFEDGPPISMPTQEYNMHVCPNQEQDTVTFLTGIHAAANRFLCGTEDQSDSETKQPPIGPSNLLTAGSTNGGIILTWQDNSASEEGFQLERKIVPTGQFVRIATVGTNVSSHTDSAITVGGTYCYRVRAFNVVGNSAYSNEACATVSAH